MQAHHGNESYASFGWTGQYDPKVNKKVLVPFAFNGVSFGMMNKWAVPTFKAFLTELVPHLPGGLHKGQCGCYNPKSTLQDGSPSFHAKGISVDVNWDTNPMDGSHYDNPKKISEELCQKYGLDWGGDWSDPHDPMHYQLQLSPQDAYRTEMPVMPLTPDDLKKIDEIVAKRFAQFFTGSDGHVHTVESNVAHVLYNWPWKSKKGTKYPGVGK